MNVDQLPSVLNSLITATRKKNCDSKLYVADLMSRHMDGGRQAYAIMQRVKADERWCKMLELKLEELPQDSLIKYCR